MAAVKIEKNRKIRDILESNRENPVIDWHFKKRMASRFLN